MSACINPFSGVGSGRVPRSPHARPAFPSCPPRLRAGPAELLARAAMRSVSYVQCVALDFAGSLFPHAICLGDADNDTVRPRGRGWGCPRRLLGAGGSTERWCGPRAGAWRSWRGFQPWVSHGRCEGPEQSFGQNPPGVPLQRESLLGCSFSGLPSPLCRSPLVWPEGEKGA